MLHILWILLKIIGIIILVILGLLVLTFGVVFLVPLKYSGSGELQKKIEKSTVNIKFSWLLHLVSGNVEFVDKKLTYEIRIFGKKLGLDKTDETNKENIGENKKEETYDEKSEESQEKVQSDSAKKITEDVIDDMTEIESKEQTKTEKRTKTKKEGIFKKIKYTFKNICDKIKVLKQKKQDVEEFLKNESHKAAFKKLWKEIGKFLRSLRPKQLVINAHFGFEDPSLTGKILAALSMLYPFYGDNIRIQPDFEQVIVEGDLHLKGKIRLIHALKMAWNLVWSRDVRKTLKDILKWNK